MIYIFKGKETKKFKIIFNHTFGLHSKYVIDSSKTVKIGRIMLE